MSQPSEKIIFESLTLFNNEGFKSFHTGNDMERAEDAASFALLDELSEGIRSGEVDISETAQYVIKLANQMKG